MAIQSGAPGTSNTASGFNAVIATRTLGVFTPGLGGRAGLGACERKDKRIGMTMNGRIMERHLSKNLDAFGTTRGSDHIVHEFTSRLCESLREIAYRH